MKDVSAMDYWVPTNYTWKMNGSRVKDTGAQLMARGLTFPTRSA